VDDNNKSLMLMTDSKYGFRSVNNSMAVTLIRGAFDPDPYPELGKHEFKFAVGLIDNENNQKLIKNTFDYNHSLQVVSGSVQSGNLEACNSFIELQQGSTALSAIKKPETEDKDNKYLIRLYEVEGQEVENVLSCFEQPVNAYFVDINENKIKGKKIKIEDNKVIFTVAPYNIASICIEF
jgi:alpha-mannosidase